MNINKEQIRNQDILEIKEKEVPKVTKELISIIKHISKMFTIPSIEL